MESIQAEQSQTILDAFMDLAGKYTVDKTTMQDIARHLGVSVGSIYHKFRGKKELIAALITRTGEALFRRIEEDTHSCRTAVDKLYAMTVTFYHHQVEALQSNRSITEFVLKGDLYVRYIRGDFTSIREELEQRYLDLLTAVLEDGTRANELRVGDARTTARILMHVFSTYALAAGDPGRREGCDREVEAAFAIMTQGIRNL
jgi:AcrR family transcriptional regulator